MRLTNIFIEKNIKLVLKEHNILCDENFEFSNINIIVGPNGSGKTRFLNAINELYKRQNIKTIYSYFPSLSSHIEPSKAKLPKNSLREYYVNKNDVNFNDFFQEIEAQCIRLFEDLKYYSSEKHKEINEILIDIIRNSLEKFINRDLIYDNNDFFIKLADNNSKPLLEDLKQMSPGERVLFYMSIFIAIQKDSENEKIIILDEPESHLHPKALISFINHLRKTIGSHVTYWIATHSLFMLPEFEFENIVCINDSVIQQRSSTMYQNLLSDMLGDKDGKIKTFFASFTYWQYAEFITKCFTIPEVIETVNSEDEQVKLFIQHLQDNKNQPYRVLDCGGGGGRLGLSLEEALLGTSKNICYDIYDWDPAYKGDKFKVYTDLKDISDTYDCVVMMNFLHEVNPDEWIPLFSQIQHLLKEDSFLFFVEVKALSQGEMPNEKGYFLLGKPELEILFNNHKLQSIVLNEKTEEKQKSSCILIPQKSLSNVTEDTALNAIRHLRNRMLKEIKVYRESNETESQNVRRYAFLLQQHMNAMLYEEYYKQMNVTTPAKIQMKLTRLEADYSKVQGYGGANIIWDGLTSLTDNLWAKICETKRSFNSITYDGKQYLLINLCYQHTKKKDAIIIFDSLEYEAESSIYISDIYLERVYSIYFNDAHDIKSFLNEKMYVDVHMSVNSNIITIPIAYACTQNTPTSVLLSNFTTNTVMKNEKINLVESPDSEMVGKIIGFLETAYLAKCITDTKEEFFYTLYMNYKNDKLQFDLQLGEETYIKYYENAKKKLRKEIEIRRNKGKC